MLDSIFHGQQWRNIGPFRGGRSNAATGVPGQPLRYYFGSTGGGVWMTEDAGVNWANISDGQFNTTSIGAIAVAPSDPNVIYVGTGEHAVRGVMTSAGDGMYKSTDAGKTWTHVGLPASRHIAEIEIHPNDPDRVYVAVQGAVHGATEERGVYYSPDGGATWERILYVDENTGAADLSLDPSNPRILYAGMWDHLRLPWEVRSGGSGSGIYKSTDGGANWERLSEGLPDTLGKVAVDVSPANPDRIFANIEAKGDKGGVYRSDDGGATWTQVCKDRITVARAWYYIEVFADPQREDVVYVLNAPMLKSIDGGRSFRPIPNPHGDQHHMWINPDNPENIILANDGGACITFNGGKSWSSQQNQPTAQFYRVITDNLVPYNVYAGQQDNSSVKIASRTLGGNIDWKDWESSAGGESAFLAFDPDNPRYVLGGSYLGNIEVYDHETKTGKDIMAKPVMGLASIPKEMEYRFNWNAPIVAQPQNPQVFYHAGNVVFRTEDLGQSWEVISPDLTRNDKEKQGPGGVPFTNEGAGGENYNTISYLVASPHEEGTLWVGTDDGLVQLTRDEGGSWTDVTPAAIGGEALINAIEVSPHNPGTAYLAVTKYKFNDFAPHIFRTTDYGATWTRTVRGIDTSHFVRVVREDPVRPGLLYAGTERGLYVSFDQGANWQPFQSNLPNAPILDMTIRDNDLVVATSGRAFWILDDLSALQQYEEVKAEVAAAEDVLALVQPKATYRFNLNTPDNPPRGAGQNPPSGLIVDYYLEAALDSTELQLDVLRDGEVIRHFTSKKAKEGPASAPLAAEAGFNRYNWDLRREFLPKPKGVTLSGDLRGGLVAPGTYTLRLYTDQDTVETTAMIKANPNLDFQQQDYIAQEQLTTQVEDAIRDMHDALNRMKDVTNQVAMLNKLLKEHEAATALVDTGKAILKKLKMWEEDLVQSKQKTFQDIINFPNQLSAELLNLRSRVDGHQPAPTESAQKRLDDLLGEWNAQRAVLDGIISEDVAAYNALYEELQLPALIVPQASSKEAGASGTVSGDDRN